MLSTSYILKNIISNEYCNCFSNVRINDISFTIPTISLSEINLGTPFFVKTLLSKDHFIIPWDVSKESLNTFCFFITNVLDKDTTQDIHNLNTFVDIYRILHYIDSPLRHKLSKTVANVLELSNLSNLINENSPTDLDMLGSIILNRLKDKELLELSIEGDVFSTKSNELVIKSDVMRLLIPEWNPFRVVLNLKKFINVDNLLDDCVCIAGGFILQNILGAKWDDSDIDIFINSYEAHLDVISKIVPVIQKVERLGVVTNVITETGKIVQLIKTDIPNNVFRNFDLAMCECLYYNGNIRLTARALKSMISKSCNINCSKYDKYTQITPNYIKRLSKYIERGFSIFLDNKLINLDVIELITVPEKFLNFVYKE